ncbi:MAG: alpha-amylase family glycosyl hydrolase [Paludibacter sp.]
MKKSIILLVLFLSVLQISAKKQQALVHRLEPTFWWTEMKNSELQLMIYGPEISKAEFIVNYVGVSISRKELTDNPNFVFLYLNIAKNTSAGKFFIQVQKGKQKQSLTYELKARRNGSAMRASFTEADAVYLLMPDRFANGNVANDSIKGYVQGVNRSNSGARHGGDIEGVISKVSYLANLGVTTLWTTPLFDNNDANYSYHHYGCTDYYKIDPRLGKNQDYLRLADTCHANGLKLIIDVVPNHCSAAHWWLKEKPANNWFNEWPSYTGSNYRMTAWTDPHASKADLNKLTKGWFAPNMPDFNLKNKLLFDYLTQVYIYWIEYANIDGIRVDTYPYNDIRVAAQFIQTIRNEYPNMNVVGECWVKTPAEIAYYQSGNNNKDGFDSRLTSVMDFCLKDVFTSSINEQEGWESGMARYYAHYAQDFVYANTNLIMNFLDNHDIDRFSTAVKRDVAKYKMGLALLIASRGYPQIYAGTEIMLDGIAGNYEGHRFDFPGGWANDKRNAFTSEGRTDEENDIFEYTRKLLNYRKLNPVLQSGKMKQFIPYDGIYVYFRYNESKTVMVIANNNSVEKTVDLERFNEMLIGKSKATNIISKAEFDINKQLNVAPKTVLLLEIN